MTDAAAIRLGYLDVGHWLPSHRADPRGIALYKRHYSYTPFADGRPYRQFVGPGETMVLLTVDCDGLFVWRKFIDDSGQQGVNCAVFRNESTVRSSELIREADELAFRRWPGERHYTYVNAQKIRPKRDPGRCFRKAGWRPCGWTKGGLLILEILPPGEQVTSILTECSPTLASSTSTKF